MAETTWTPVQLRALPRWWERAALKPQHVLAQWGRADVQVLLDAYEAERARVERLAKVVRSVEWGGPAARLEGSIQRLCLFCNNWQDEGHTEQCPFRAALAGDAPGRGEARGG